MASPPATGSESTILQAAIGRIPTPLGPNLCPDEDVVCKNRTDSLASQSHSINGDITMPPESIQANGYQTPATQLQEHNKTCIDKDGPDKKRKPEKFTKSQLFTLCAISFANLCSATFYSLLAPFFPTEASQKGASETEIGLIMGAFQAVVLIFSPVFGNYMTMIGPRFMFITGTFATSTCVILFGMLQWCPPGTIYVGMCLCVRSIEALSAAATTTSSQAIAAHTFSTRLSSVMGILQACSCIGLMIGPPIGGALYALGGFYLPFVVSGGLFMLGGVVSVILLPPQEAEPKVQTGSKLALLKIPAIPLVGHVAAAGQFAMGFTDVSLAIHLKQFELHPALVGMIFLIPAIVVVLLAPVVGCLTDRLPLMVWPLMIAGTAVATVGFLIMGPTPLLSFLPSNQLWMVILGLFLAGLGWVGTVVCFPIFVKAAHEKGFPDTMETQGLVSGVYNAFNSLGALIGPTVGGLMLQRLHFPWACTIIASSIALAGLLVGLYTMLAISSSCSKKQEDQTTLVENAHFS